MTLNTGLLERQKKLISDLRRLLHQYSTETKRADTALASNLKQSQDDLAVVEVESQKAMLDIASDQQSAVNILAESHRADLRRISTLKFPRVHMPALGTNPSYSDELRARWSKARAIALVIKDLITALDKQTKKQRELSLARQALALCAAAIVVTAYIFTSIGMGQASWSLLWWLLFAAFMVALANSRWNLTANQAGEGFNWLYILGGPISILFALYYVFYAYHKSVNAISKKYIAARGAKQILDEIVASLRILSSLRSEAEYIKSTWLKQTKSEKKQKMASLKAAHRSRLNDLKKVYELGRDQIYSACQVIRQESALIGSDWSDPLWKSWSPTRTQLAPLVRIGLLRESQDRRFVTPAFVPLIGGKNVLIKSPGDPQAKVQARRMIKNIVQRLLATCAAGKVRFTFIDPTTSGENLGLFMSLKEFDRNTVGAKIYTEDEDIEDQLKLLKEHIEVVNEKYLRNKHKDIASYNREAGDVEEPYRVLVIEDFPRRFSDRSIQRVEDIIRSGNRCGVYTLVLMDTDEQLPYMSGSKFVDELERNSTVVEWIGGRFVLRDRVFSQSLLEIDNESSLELLDKIMEAVGPRAQAAGQINVPFESIVPYKQGLWTEKSASKLSIPIGRDLERNCSFSFTIGRMADIPPNILISGQVGQGKSNLLHVIVTAMCSLYSPDEINFYLLDMKQGVEFQKYVKPDIPHMRLIVVCSDRELGLAILKKVEGTLNERSRKFKDYKNVDIDHIETYRSVTKRPLPRVILVIDEYHVLFSESDSIASEAGAILDKLLRQGRAYGVHVVLSTQSVRGSGRLQDSSMDQIGIRIAMRLSDDESRLVLGENNPAASHLTRVGEAIFNGSSGAVPENKRIQIAQLSPDRHKAYLDRLTAMATRSGQTSEQSKIVVDATVPAYIDNCAGLSRLLKKPLTSHVPTEVDFWLGEPMDLRFSALSLEQKNGDNVILFGSNQELMVGVFCASLFGVLLQYPSNSVQVAVVNLMGGASKFAPIVNLLSTTLAKRVDVIEPRSISSFLCTVGEELNTYNALDIDGHGLTIRHRYIFLLGLHRAKGLAERNLGNEEDEDDTRRFIRILSSGPAHGTHVWAWCEDFSGFRVRVGNDSLEYFQKRVVLQVSESDSFDIIGSYAAGKLGSERALLYDTRNNELRKIKPFSVPILRWIQKATDRILESDIVSSKPTGGNARTANTDTCIRINQASGSSQPRCPCLLLLDTSKFMKNDAIKSLSNGLSVFKEHVLMDQLASDMLEIAVVTFDSDVQIINDFITIRDLKPVILQVQDSLCCIGAGINRALDMIDGQRQKYKSNGVTYYRPWIFMITSGRFKGESADVIQAAGTRVRQEEAGKRLAFFAVGVDNADPDALKGIAARTPARTDAINFNEMFSWLAASIALKCHSNIGATISLPPSLWRTG